MTFFLVEIQQLKEKLSADKVPRIKKKKNEIMALELALQKEMCCEKDTIKSRSARERTTEDERERESSREDSKNFHLRVCQLRVQG